MELTAVNAGQDLISGLAIGWYFGSVSMVIFGVIVIVLAVKVHRQAQVSLAPAMVIALGYLVFGLTVFVTSDFNPHFLLFVLTGVLLGTFAYQKNSRH